MLFKLLFFLSVYISTNMLNDACAEDYGRVDRKKNESGSLEAIALRDSWKLEQIDSARDVGYLTDIEKDIILALNMVRTEPGRYAELYIKPIINSFNGKSRRINGRNLITEEGSLPAEELYEYLIHHSPVLAFVVAQELCNSADELAHDQSMTGETGHISSHGKGFSLRIKSYGRWKNGVSEMIGYGGKTAFDIVNNMLIDDGVSDRGHRFIIMDPLFHVVGASVRPHKVYGLTTVIDYAGSFAKNFGARN